METTRLNIHKVIHRKMSVAFSRIAEKWPRAKILVGISGGMDSTLLAHHCADFKKTLGCSFVFAHVNHKQRGQASEEDEAFCRTLSESLAVPFVSQSLTFTSDLFSHSEAELRTKRYHALSTMKHAVRADLVMLAHHANDQAETFLMRMASGSDIRGLCSMRCLTDDLWFRPMLNILKSEIEKESRQLNMSYRCDESNALTSFGRNFIRHNVMPLLQTQVNPKLVNQLCALSASISDIEDFLQGQVCALVTASQLGIDTYCVNKLSKAHVAVLRPLLQLEFERFSGGVSLTRKHIYMLESAVYKGRGNKVILLPAGKAARIHKKQLQWYQE